MNEVEYTIHQVSNNIGIVSLTNVVIDGTESINKFDSNKTFNINDEDNNDIEKYIASVINTPINQINFICTNSENK